MSASLGQREAEGRSQEASVWVCVPTYNERPNVGNLIHMVRSVLLGAGMNGHVLVIDDNSPDGTAEVVNDIAASDEKVHLLHRDAKRGIGPAYIAGFKYALDQGASLIIQLDCDFSHNPADIPHLTSAATNADLVIGSRYASGGQIEDWGLLRRAISRGGCLYAQSILRTQVRDLTSGFKCFRREVLESVPIDEVSGRGYGFQIEMTYRTLLQGFRVVEIPITFTDRTAGESKMSRDIVLEAATLVPRIRRRLGPIPRR